MGSEQPSKEVKAQTRPLFKGPSIRMYTDPAVRVPKGKLNVGVVGAQLGCGVLKIVLRPEPHSGDRVPKP